MISDLATHNLQKMDAEFNASSSGSWDEILIKNSKTPRMPPWPIKIAGILLALAAPSTTTIPDYWLIDKRRRYTTTVAWMDENIVGRPISRLKALQIVADILIKAERERMAMVEWEATHGIHWEAEE